MTAPTLERGQLAPQSARNASLQELGQLLSLQKRQAVDLVLPASSVRLLDGKLEIAGADPILRDDGVLDPNGAYSLTSHADGQLAGQFDIPVKYLRRMRTENVPLLDVNVNDWANHESYEDKKILARLFWAQDPSNPGTVGVARAFLSNRYGARDNFDALVSTLDGIREAGLAADSLKIHGDLTDKNFYLVVDAPEVRGYAHKLLEGYRNPYADGRGTGHGGIDAENLPIVSAGFIIKNSEIGASSLSITPRIVIRTCGNGVQVSKDVVAFRHVGARLDEGNIEWATDTRDAVNTVQKKQVRDAVQQFLTAEYVQKTVEELERDSDAPVNEVSKVIEAVSQEFSYTEDEASSLLNFFIDGGQRTAGGVFNAVTAMVQQFEDADRAYEVEATAVPAMAFAAKLAQEVAA